MPGSRGLLAGFTAGFSGGRVGGIGIGVVAAVLVLLVGRRRGGSAVKQDARFQGQRLALGFERGRHCRTGLGRHVHIITLSPGRGQAIRGIATQRSVPQMLIRERAGVVGYQKQPSRFF
ncbi:hypothetical protein D3C79_787790 [compost metagenome]